MIKLYQNIKKYDVYVDGSLKGTFDYFQSGANDIGEVLFSVPPGSTGTFYISDIKIYNL